MPGRNSTWPVFLNLQGDPNTAAKVDAFKRQVGSGFADIGKAGIAAGRQLDNAFTFNAANKRLDELGRKLREVTKFAATGQFTPIDRSVKNDPLAVRNNIGTRADTARTAFNEARIAGASASEATAAATRAVGNLNASFALMDQNARRAAGGVGFFGGRAQNAFSVAAGAAGVFQGALGGVASRLGFLGQLFNTIGAKGTLAIGALAGGGALIGAGAQLQNYQNLLRSTTNSEAEFAAAQEATSRIAAASRSSLSDTIQSYAKLSINSKELGLSTRELEGVLTTVQQAIQLSGSNAQEASAAMLQFGQALASNKLSGDEFRSLGENATKVLQTIRLGLEKTGDVKGFDGTIASFRQLSKEGQLTGSVVSRALLAMGRDVNSTFQRMPVTITQAQNKISNSFLEIGLSIEKTLHPLALTAGAMNALGNNMDVLASIAGGLGVAFAANLIPKLALMVGTAARSVVAFVSLTRTFGFTQAAAAAMAGQTGVLRGLMAALFTTTGLLTGGLTIVAGALIYFAQKGSEASQAANILGVSLDSLTGKAARTAAGLRDATFAAQELARTQARTTTITTKNLALDAKTKVIAAANDGRLFGALTGRKPVPRAAIEAFSKNNDADALLRAAKAAGVTGKAYTELTERVGNFTATVRGLGQARKFEREVLSELSKPPTAPRPSGGGGGVVKTAGQVKAELDQKAAVYATSANTLAGVRARYNKAIGDLERSLGGAKGIAKLSPEQQADYIAQRSAIKEGYDGQVAAIKAGAAGARSAKSAAAKEAREAAAAAKAHAVNEGQQALADGKVLGSATDELAAARARYSAAIVAIRNKQQEGTITDAAAKEAAAKAQADLLSAKAAIEAAENLFASYSRIASEFDGEPKFIDKIQKARAELDALDKAIADSGVGRIEKDGVFITAQDAADARKNVEEGLIKPITDAKRAMQQAAEVQDLILQGREDEAEFLQKANDLLEQYGTLTGDDLARVKEQLAGLRQLTREEFQRNRAIEARNKIVDNLVSNAENLQEALTGVLAEPFKASSYKNLFNTLVGDFKKTFFDSLSTQLFGNLGQGVSDIFKRSNDPLGAAGDDLSNSAIDQHNAAVALSQSADNLNSAASALGGAAGPSAGALTTTPGSFGLGALTSAFSRTIGGGFESLFTTAGPLLQGFGKIGGTANTGIDLGRAVQVQTDIAKQSVQLQRTDPLRSNPVAAYNQFGAAVGKKLDGTFGTGGIFEKVGGKLGSALQGIAIGQQTGQLAGLFGLKTSALGSSIGGALGGAFFGPIGAAVGGFLGSIVGGLFKKTKKAYATVGANDFGSLDLAGEGGNSGKRKTATSSAANGIIDAVEQLASQFGVELNAAVAGVTIGLRGKDFVVDPSGSGKTKGKGIVNFGEDEKAAVEFAIRNLIEDGVLKGIRAGTKKLLLNSRTLESGIAKAIKFENVFRDLKRLTDPVGAAIDELDVKFNELRRIFAEAGASAAETADLERLYGLERAEAVKTAAKDVASTLADLLKELTYSGDSGLSLRTRQAGALAAFNPLRAQVEGGQVVDQQAFADAARSLLEIQRQIYGSTSAYFDSLSLVTALTRRAIANAGGIQPAGTAGPVTTTGGFATVGGSSSGVAGAATTAATGAVTAAVGAAAVDVKTAAANDNFTMAEKIVASINAQTQALLPLTQEQLVATIQAAMIGLRADATQSNGQSSVVYAMRPIADAILASNGAVRELLTNIRDNTEATAEGMANSGIQVGLPTTVGGLFVSQSDGSPINGGYPSSAPRTGSGGAGFTSTIFENSTSFGKRGSGF